MAAARRTRKAIEATELTPFAATLEEWGYQQRPIIKTRADLARRLGIPINTVNNWFAHGQQPRAESVWQVAQLTGLDAKELFTAAGYEAIPPDPNHELRGKITDGVFDWLRAQIDREGTLSTTERAKLLGLMKRWQEDKRIEYEIPSIPTKLVSDERALPRARRGEPEVAQSSK